MNRQDAMYHALRFLKKSETLGSYFEFGLFQGQSIVTAYKIHSQIDDFPRHFYGFDSFSGLPRLSEEDNLKDYGVFYEGQFSVSKSQVSANLIKNGMPDNSFTLIEGFYNEFEPLFSPRFLKVLKTDGFLRVGFQNICFLQ